MMRASIAVLLFATVVAHADDDPARPLAERGFAALRAHDLDRAEALTRAAIDKATTQEVLGAAWYNLGLVAEERGDRASAISDYESSMKARPHRVARKKLEALAPEIAGAYEPFAPVGMHGSSDAPDGSCPRDPTDAPVKTLLRADARRGVPWLLELRVSAAPCDRRVMMLAVRTAKGWFTAEVVPEDSNLMHCNIPVYRVAGPTIRGTVATFEYWGRSSCSHRNDDWQWSEHGVVMFGIGPSGVPAVVPAIAIDRATVTWAADGSFDLEGQVGSSFLSSGVDDRENRRGQHRLVFP